MNLVQYLLEKFFKEEWFNAISMITTSSLLTLLQANGISMIISNLIEALQKHNKSASVGIFKWFVFASISYVVLFQIYKYFQNKLLTKLRQWIRQQLVNAMLIINNSDFSEINFVKMNSPINRVSSTVFMSVNDWLTYILPNIVFLLVTALYLLYTNRSIGLVFIFGNIAIIAYMLYNMQNMIDLNAKYEESVADTENYLQEILNNIEKIIYRGQTDNEMKAFGEKSQQGVNDAYAFYSSTTIHGTVMNFIAIVIICIIIWQLIALYFKDNVPLTTVITFITILTLYRENMGTLIRQIPDTLEFVGRTQTVIKKFSDMNMSYVDAARPDIPDQGLEINSIKFENVTFSYKNADKPILNNLNFEIRPTVGKIIGIRGKSGSGKSTLSKIMLKMNRISSGRILIDGKDINEISEKELRKKITYIDQRGKMFEKGIKYNVLYGCGLGKECESGVKEVMRKGVVSELMRRVVLNESSSGKVLGEKLSGGERQITNVISGLISESGVLILDEPTTGLDGELKKGVLELIEEYKEKKCIIIITHDKEVYRVLDETLYV